MPSPHQVRQMIDAVRKLNTRWARRALSIWQGHRVDVEPDRIYAGFEALLTPATIAGTAGIQDQTLRTRIRHGLIDHYLQRKLMPHETEMQAWSRGAAAHVDGEKIYFREVIPWCQKSSTLAKRQKLQQETAPLCKLLKPFAVNYWNIVLESLTGELGFDSYIDYCSRKKGLDYHRFYEQMKDLVERTDAPYFDAMNAWSHRRFGLPADQLTRFDAIYLLSLGQWDRLCPVNSPQDALDFFSRWGIDPRRLAGLHLHIRSQADQSAQALSIMVNIPDDVHLLMRPEGGWIDIETLWHELGHGLSAVFTDPALPAVDRELATTFSLSEVYAFLLQRMALSPPVLEKVWGLSTEAVTTISHYKELKDLSVFRRYAAKFISEYEMFTGGDLSDGRPYAETMGRITGFYHQPESHLFDLVPEFYCADYLLGWMGEAALAERMAERFGKGGYLLHEAGRWLRSLWFQGNRLDIVSFFEQNGLGRLSADSLLNRWRMAVPI
jgi:hypothetical protein